MVKNNLLFLAVAFTVLTTQAYAQQGTKIGVISLQELIASMPEAAKADSLLQNLQKELQSTYVEMVKEYQSKDSIFAIDSAKFSATTKELKKNDIARLARDIQKFQQSVEETLQKKQQELILPIRTQATEAVQSYAKKNGYVYVAEKGVFYVYPDTTDILDGVKKELKIGAPVVTKQTAPKQTSKK